MPLTQGTWMLLQIKEKLIKDEQNIISILLWVNELLFSILQLCFEGVIPTPMASSTDLSYFYSQRQLETASFKTTRLLQRQNHKIKRFSVGEFKKWLSKSEELEIKWSPLMKKNL